MQRRTCAARKKNGMPCQGPAVTGSDKCRMHLGKKTQGLKVQAEASRLLHRMDAPLVENPLTALQALAGRALALEQAIGGIVNDLNSIRYDGIAGGEQLRSEVVVLERAMDRAGRLLVDIAKLNIEDRLAKVTEAQTAMVADALAAVLGEMGLSPDQQRDARSRVGRRLRSVA